MKVAALAFTAVCSTAAAAAVCTGKSADLPAKECAAWQDFYDALGGPAWSNFGSDGRADPCSVKSKIGDPCKGGPAAGAAAARRLEQQHQLRQQEQRRRLAEGSGGALALAFPPWQEPDAGVCCQVNAATGQKHITQLAFAINNLRGAVPASILDLEALDNLSCCNNAINGTVPPLPASLQFLRMSTNKLTGVDASLAAGGNSALTFLSLRDNAIEGPLPNFPASLTRLTDLYMDCNKLSGPVPTGYGNFSLPDKCFISASTLLETCGGTWDNAFDCPLPGDVKKNCHAVCKK